MKKAFFIILVIAIAAVGFFFFGPMRDKMEKDNTSAPAPGQAPLPPARVEVLKVEPMETFQKGYNESSTLEAIEEVVLYPKVSARLEELKVNEGDKVIKGQVLAELDHRDVEAQIDSIRAQIAVAEARLASSRANYSNAKNEVERYRKLVQEGYATTQQLEAKETLFLQGEADVRLSSATLDQAKAELQKQQVLLSEYFIRSPIDATVIEDYSHTPGAMLSPSVPVLHLGRIDRLKAVIKAPEARATLFSTGMRATVCVESISNCTMEGVVSKISPQVDTRTRTVIVEVEVPNSGNRLKPGMFAEVFVIEQEVTNALVIPVSAVHTEEAGKFVFRVEDGQARKVPVETGLEMDLEVQVTEGVNEGDAIVISGGDTLKDGEKVSVVE
ncbi:MAG TPA: efflux RND transporter periplasmic adaptor subunit [Synergistales bacterium]|nr:efflux RND transporter periplasmic adaptor subunit [Synergistales bacterium]